MSEVSPRPGRPLTRGVAEIGPTAEWALKAGLESPGERIATSGVHHLREGLKVSRLGGGS